MAAMAVEQEAVVDLVENGTRVEAGLIDCQRELQRGEEKGVESSDKGVGQERKMKYMYIP